MSTTEVNEYIQTGLHEQGCSTVSEWLEELAVQYNVPFYKVAELAALLGPSELFDGLVSAVQDIEGDHS